MAERPESFARVDDQAFVAPLKEMASLVAQLVEPGGKSALQPTHSLPQIGLRCGHRQMVVVRHNAPRVHPPARAGTSFFQTAEKGRLGAV